MTAAMANDLHETLDATRLLELSPGPRGSPLNGRLHKVFVNDDLVYTALSYVWGKPANSPPVIFIQTHDKEIQVPITPNLAVALDHLRDAERPLTLWVDAVCINQSDNAEKSVHVQLMNKIYGKATKTIIWLGEEADGSNLAMDLIANLDGDDLESPRNKFDAKGLEVITNLLNRPWWTRVWVIQEAILSPDPVVRCGSKTLPISNFVRLDDIRRGFHRKSWTYQGQHMDMFPINPFAVVLTDFDQERAAVAQKRSTLSGWLAVTQGSKATDARDKIYALLGMSEPDCPSWLKPDYEKSVAVVYSQATAYAILQTGLLLLHFNRDVESIQADLPSWVQDYSVESRYTSIMTYSAGYNPTKNIEFGTRKNKGNQYWPITLSDLNVRGIVVDKVLYVGKNEHYPRYHGLDVEEKLENIRARVRLNLERMKKWEAKVESMSECRYEPGQSKMEAFWRTLTMDRDFDGAKLEFSPKNPYYEIWRGREEVPESFRQLHTDKNDEEVKRIYCRPFILPSVSRCTGRSFIITKNGYFGVAPLKTEPGDFACVLEQGETLYVLRQNVGEKKEELVNEAVTYTFIGESYVHGLMDGEAGHGKSVDDVTNLIIK